MNLHYVTAFVLSVVTLLSTCNVRNINHPLCGCAVNVTQKNHLLRYNKGVQAVLITKER